MATINITFVPEDDLTIFNVIGDLTAEEILKYSTEYYELKPTKFVMWDATKGTVKNITTEDFRKIATEMKTYTQKRSGGKTALVGKFDLDFGLSRMYSSYTEMEQVPIAYGSFYNVDDAMAWLKE